MEWQIKTGIGTVEICSDNIWYGIIKTSISINASNITRSSANQGQTI